MCGSERKVRKEGEEMMSWEGLIIGIGQLERIGL